MLKRRPVSSYAIHLAIVAALMGVASVVLFSMLGRESLWVGEGETWSWSTQSMHQILNITSSSFHPPAYFVALKIWIRLVGDSEFMLRLPSATMFILSIPVAYLFGRAIHSSKAGVLVALLVATSPYLFQYAVESRSYMTLFFGGASALCCLAWALKWKGEQPYIGSSISSLFVGEHRIKYDLVWAGFAVSILVAMFSHFAAILLPLVTVSIVLSTVLLERAGSKRLLVNAAIVHGLVLVFYVIHPYGLLAYLISPASPGFDITFVSQVLGLAMLYGFEHSLPALFIPLGCVGLVVARWWQDKAWGWLSLALIGWLAVLAVGFLSEFVVGSVFRPRIFIWTTFPFYVMVAVGALQIRKKYLLIPLLGIILASNVYGVVMEYNTTNTPWNVITKELVNRVSPDDGLIICPGWTEFGLQPYYSKAKAPAISTYKWRWHKEQGGQILPLDSDYTDHHRLWVVVAHPHACDEDNLAMHLQDWNNEVYRLRLDYGVGEPSASAGRYMRKVGIDGGITAERAMTRSYILLYALERQLDSAGLGVQIE